MTDMAAKEAFEPHPLVGLDNCWNLVCKKSLKFHRKPWQVWLIRTVYYLCQWSGDFCREDFGTFTDYETVLAIAVLKNKEAREKQTGDVWEIVETPVNRVLPYKSIRYGIREYPNTDIDARMRARKPDELIDCKAVKELKTEYASQFCEFAAEAGKTRDMAREAAKVLIV